METEASKTKSDYFLYVVAYLAHGDTSDRLQVYRAYSHSGQAKDAARHVWNDKLRNVWGEPIVTGPAVDDKSIPQATLTLESDEGAYEGTKPYVRQQVVVEKVFMDSRFGDALRKTEAKLKAEAMLEAEGRMGTEDKVEAGDEMEAEDKVEDEDKMEAGDKMEAEDTS